MEAVLLFIGLVALVYWVLAPTKTRAGTIQTKLGPLQYISGDALDDNYGRTFHGVEITLPKKLPHMYIDGHNADNVFYGPRFVFKKQSRLSLEGDFDRYFQVYAVSHYHRVVLGILQPNVMAQLVDILADYDVEIWHDKLRIIANKKVYNKPIEPDMQKLAAALTDTLAPTIRRWKRSDEEEAGNLQMSLQRDSMTKIGRRSVSSFTVLSAPLLIAIASPIALIGYLTSGSYIKGGDSLYWYIATLLIFPGLWFVLIIARRKGWV